MKRAIAVSVLSILVLTGCGESSRFGHIETIWEKGMEIVYDKETGVEYASGTITSGKGFMTVLVDQNGKPVIYPEYKAQSETGDGEDE